MKLTIERNTGQFSPDVMAKISPPAPVSDLAAICEILTREAKSESKEAYLSQEGAYFIIRSLTPKPILT